MNTDVNSLFDDSNFPTSDQALPAELQEETDRMLDEVLLSLKLERAVIFVKHEGCWRVGSVIEVPRDDFWNLAPISLGVLHSAAKNGQLVHLVDAGTSAEFGGRDSIIITGIRSVVCAPYQDGQGQTVALLYADNRIATGAFSPSDVETVQELALELGRRLFK